MDMKKESYIRIENGKWSMFVEKRSLLLVVAFFLINFIYHIDMPLNGDGSAWFAHSLENMSMFSFLKLRYFEWSSRTLIDFITVLLCYSPLIVWKILDSLVFTMIGVMIIKITEVKEFTLQIFVYALCALYPYGDLNTAGWLVTTLNYSWVLLAILIGIYYALEAGKRKINGFETLLGVFCFVLGANTEQGLVIIVSYLAVYTIICFINRKMPRYILISGVMVLIEACYIIFSPGNERRSLSDNQTFPEIANLSFGNKCELGLSSTLFHFIFTPRILFLIFTLLLIVIMFEIKKNVIYRCFATIPFFTGIVFGFFETELYSLFPWLFGVENTMLTTGVWDIQNPKSIICWLIMLIVVMCILISIVGIISEFPKEGMSILIAIGIGFASRCMMGFSATIWASGDRTYIYLYFAFVIACMYIMKVLSKEKREKINCLVIPLAGLSVLHLWTYVALGSF